MADLFPDANKELAILRETAETQQALYDQLMDLYTKLHERVEAIEDSIGNVEPPPPIDPPPVDPPPDDDGDPPPPPPPSNSGYVWLDPARIKKLPTTGEAWKQVVQYANRKRKPVDLGSLNTDGDVETLARALVATRNDDDTMRGEVVKSLEEAIEFSNFKRALELGRGAQAYILAAALVNYRTKAMYDWVDKIVNLPISGHDGVGLLGTTKYCANNWAHARTAVAIAAVFSQREDWMGEVLLSHKEFIGMDVSSPRLKFKTRYSTWHADPNHPMGINPKGSKRGNIVIDGVIGEDWRRQPHAYDFVWPPPDPNTTYLWETMQNLTVTAAVLHEHGLLDFGSADNAMVRAMQMLYGEGAAAANNPRFVLPPSGDDKWIVPLVNYYGNTSFESGGIGTPGKNMGFTGWIFGS